jgi:transposase
LRVKRYITYVIPRRREREGPHAGQVDRRTALDRETYARRNVVKRCVNCLKQLQGIATCYEKRSTNYRAMVVIRSLMMWIQWL